MPKPKRSAKKHPQPAFLFDLDGTLIDSVYEHILAWREALSETGIELSNWFIHRRIGMSDSLMLNACMREAGRKLSPKQIARLRELHTEAYMKRVDDIGPLPGAKDLLKRLTKLGVPWAIGTTSVRERAEKSLKLLGIADKAEVVTGDEVKQAKPEPDLFLAAAKKLNMDLDRCVVVGDSVWDLLAAQRAHALGVGLLSGGYGEEELARAGAYRVYRDPADLLGHLDEIGVDTLGEAG
jgi:HAD superfamily hydrolase (TIGR01509 family)